jgi:hypothetical protein
VALFRVQGDVAHGERIRGAAEPVVAGFSGMRIPLQEAAALETAARSGDPVTAAATPPEISARLADLLGHAPESLVSIFPVAGAGGCEALLYAWGAVEGPALELLAQAAGAFWGSHPVTAADEEPERIITIAPAPPAEPAAAPAAERPEAGAAAARDIQTKADQRSAPLSWEQFSPEDRRLHLRAQRSARVEASAMRLRCAAEVQAGRARRDLYGALRQQIDAAREAFRKSFFEPCPSMVDYLHLELVRTLAHDDPELLGKDYPGIMA